MITSFYFVLWIAVYLLIDFSGVAFLQQYAFFVAFLAVILLGRWANELWRRPIEDRSRRDFNAILEIFYTKDYARLVSIRRRDLWLAAASFIYMAVATVLLFVAEEWVIGAIFGFIAFQMGREMHRSYASYSALRSLGTMPEPEGEFSDALAQYSHVRSYRSYRELLPPPSTGEKALRIFNIVIAVLCLVIGVVFLYLFGSIVLYHGTRYPGAVINALYGALALLYGTTDLVSMIRGYNYSISI